MSVKMMNKMMTLSDDSDDEESDENMIKVEENRVHFHSPVNRESCFKLIECLRKAQEYVALRCFGVCSDSGESTTKQERSEHSNAKF